MSWKAEIIVNCKKVYLGSFNTAIEASDVYQEARTNKLQKMGV